MSRNTIAFIKKTLHEGYSQKQIQMITKENPSRIQRVAANKTYLDVSPLEYEADSFFEFNKKTLNRILSLQEIAGHGPLSEQDINYIRLLKYCGAKYQDVRWLYSDRPLWDIRQVWISGDKFDRSKFSPLQIGITLTELKILLD